MTRIDWDMGKHFGIAKGKSDMIIRPLMTPAANAVACLAVANDLGTEPLVIRKGTAVARLRAVLRNDFNLRF